MAAVGLIRVSSRRGGGVWRSLVAHLLWEQGVGGSNPSTPTTFSGRAGPDARPCRVPAGRIERP